ncbi:MBL fold metallo-hydrolase [Thermomicrobium sp. 4228-Ro]|uniref:MBL fold metallo-hydrolase n=1 Tax=Thermomicrobium sp. 4228-Ro TaxID=2993937 RepID=UPI002248F725|nr:MBL fold metallo-hydrolase [Thermomicrobium sp. 4228-Ro]MCX2727493.1 MBL fold metallo-hydrolase [Thermomicrobium sp. 4228-Ro]
MSEIKWLGHACVRLRGRDVTVVMDPVAPETGYHPPKQRADIVTVSHAHPGHRYLDLVRPGYRLIDGPGEYEIKGTFITGIRTYHDEERGARLGKNTVYVVDLDGVQICHLGDLGHTLSDEQAELLSEVDVLLVPVGGGTTLDADRAVEVVGQIEPHVVIPLQFRTEHGDSGREPVERFLRAMGVTEWTTRESLTVRKGEFGEAMEVVVLVPDP